MSFSLLLPYLSIIYAASRISLNFNPASPPPIATASAFLVSDVTNQSSCAQPLSSTKSESFHVIPLLRDILWLARAFTIKSSISEWLSKSFLVLPHPQSSYLFSPDLPEKLQQLSHLLSLPQTCEYCNLPELLFSCMLPPLSTIPPMPPFKEGPFL